MDDSLCPVLTCSFNDVEVLKFNKRPVTLPTWKMAECYDYPQADLMEFYEQLADFFSPREIKETRWSKKSGKLWSRLHERRFYVRRAK